MSDCKIYPADTVDTVGENMIDSTIYPADTVDSVGENMSDSTIYPADTVDSVGENMSDSTIYPAGTVDSVGENISDCKIYPADTVDIYGNVWPTVGENIRNGIFGENVKVGYVNINNGTVTSPNFIISDTYESSFKIENIRVFSVFPENIENGTLNISIGNLNNYVIIRNAQKLDAIVASIKIIYKELI